VATITRAPGFDPFLSALIALTLVLTPSANISNPSHFLKLGMFYRFKLYLKELEKRCTEQFEF
jgi:hypothetical protein